MRILCTLTYYWPHRTGLTRYAQYVAEELTARGHQVTVLTSRYLDSLPRDQTLNGVRVVRLRPMARISRGQVMPGFPLAAYRLIRQHDAVLIHAPMLEAPLVALLAERAGRGVVITHHGDLVLPSGALNRFIEAIMSRLFHAAAKTANCLVGTSDDYVEHSAYLKPHITKTFILYPPIRMPEPSPQGGRRLRQALGVGSAPLIGYSGRFVEEKRPDLLVRALAHLDSMVPGAHVAFAGQYIMPYEKYYERHVRLLERYRDRVHFLGLIEDDHQLADFYSACDVLALPSDTENFALVQVEAMLSGTPVVVTDIPGAREAVRVTGMGEVARPRDTFALARGLARVLKDPDRYVKPREEILRIFDFNRTIDGYESILTDAAQFARNR